MTVIIRKSVRAVHTQRHTRIKRVESKEKCAKWEEYNVSCTKRNATFAFTPKLIEVETGRVVYSNVSDTATASVCEDSQKPLASGSELIGRTKKSALAMFRNDIAPYYVQFEIKLIDSTDGIARKKQE